MKSPQQSSKKARFEDFEKEEQYQNAMPRFGGESNPAFPSTKQENINYSWIKGNPNDNNYFTDGKFIPQDYPPMPSPYSMKYPEIYQNPNYLSYQKNIPPPYFQAGFGERFYQNPNFDPRTFDMNRSPRRSPDYYQVPDFAQQRRDFGYRERSPIKMRKSYENNPFQDDRMNIYPYNQRPAYYEQAPYYGPPEYLRNEREYYGPNYNRAAPYYENYCQYRGQPCPPYQRYEGLEPEFQYFHSKQYQYPPDVKRNPNTFTYNNREYPNEYPWKNALSNLEALPRTESRLYSPSAKYETYDRYFSNNNRAQNDYNRISRSGQKLRESSAGRVVDDRPRWK